MSICNTISIGASYDCENPIQAGLQPQIIIMNKDDILSYTILNNKITDITLKGGKQAYLFEGIRSSINAEFERVDTGLSNGYSHNVAFQVFDITSTQKLNLEVLAIVKTVVIVFNKNVLGNEDGYFEVFGIGAGLEGETLTRINRDQETNGSFSVSLKTSDSVIESKVPYNFFDTDYDTTLAKILDLLIPPAPGAGFPYTLPYTLS